MKLGTKEILLKKEGWGRRGKGNREEEGSNSPTVVSGSVYGDSLSNNTHNTQCSKDL